MTAAVQTIIEQLGRIDVVVANAGITPPPATLRQIDPDAFDRARSFTGVFNTVHPTIDEVIRNSGHIVVVSSAASKAGVEALGRALRSAVAGYGATAGIAYFGMVDTQLARATLDDDEIGRKLDARLTRSLGHRISRTVPPR
ncbi:unnamed protein product, partial [Mesorhabditis spiculigera]